MIEPINSGAGGGSLLRRMDVQMDTGLDSGTYQTAPASNANAHTQGRTRGGAIQGVVDMFTLPGISQAFQRNIYRGRLGTEIKSFTLPGGWARHFCLWKLAPALDRPPVAIPREENATFQMSATFAWAGLDNTDKFRGWEILLPGFTEVNQPELTATGATLGWGLRRNGAGQVVWMARATPKAFATQFDETFVVTPWATPFSYHQRITMRLFSATVDNDARLDVLLNGGLILSRNWGVGTVLPVYSAIPSALGFMSYVDVMTADASHAIELSEFLYMSGPDDPDSYLP